LFLIDMFLSTKRSTLVPNPSNRCGNVRFSGLKGGMELSHRSVHRHALEPLAQHLDGSIDAALREFEGMEQTGMDVPRAVLSK